MNRAHVEVHGGRRPPREAAAVSRGLERSTTGIRRLLRDNGLSLAFLGMFLLALFAGQGLAGRNAYNEEQREHGQPEVGYGAFLKTPDFIEALSENWESEFLEMMLFTTFTALLVQKGSAESKDPREPPEDLEAAARRKDAPWPVRRGGWICRIYAYSLSLAFLVLFLGIFFVHAASGAGKQNEENRQHGNPERVTTLEFLSTSQFWFQSFQNWQSEFMGLTSMIVLSIWLRHRDSAESKKVGDPHSKTGKS
ncbi:MAG TPA: DUF6766 family protein [Candidatus Polarisedimenticolia bacterium]|nr:DUF6766 family protein [Candidatus Polarisedimenticolia bacterium]